MKKAAVLILVVAGIVIASVMSEKMRHRTRLDLTLDEPPFKNMQLPPHEVLGSIYMDGGSVWMRITERNGQVTHLIFPYDSKSRSYPTALHGIQSIGDHGAKPFKHPERAKEIAIEILERYGKGEGAHSAHQHLLAHPHSLRGKIRALFSDD